MSRGKWKYQDVSMILPDQEHITPSSLGIGKSAGMKFHISHAYSLKKFFNKGFARLKPNDLHNLADLSGVDFEEFELRDIVYTLVRGFIRQGFSTQSILEFFMRKECKACKDKELLEELILTAQKRLLGWRLFSRADDTYVRSQLRSEKLNDVELTYQLFMTFIKDVIVLVNTQEEKFVNAVKKHWFLFTYDTRKWVMIDYSVLCIEVNWALERQGRPQSDWYAPTQIETAHRVLSKIPEYKFLCKTKSGIIDDRTGVRNHYNKMDRFLAIQFGAWTQHDRWMTRVVRRDRLPRCSSIFI